MGTRDDEYDYLFKGKVCCEKFRRSHDLFPLLAGSTRFLSSQMLQTMNHKNRQRRIGPTTTPRRLNGAWFSATVQIGQLSRVENTEHKEKWKMTMPYDEKMILNKQKSNSTLANYEKFPVTFFRFYCDE